MREGRSLAWAGYAAFAWAVFVRGYQGLGGTVGMAGTFEVPAAMRGRASSRERHCPGGIGRARARAALGIAVAPLALIVHGDRDALVPIEASGHRAAPMIRDCTLVVYENASHWPFVTHRERLNDQLTAFARAEQPVAS